MGLIKLIKLNYLHLNFNFIFVCNLIYVINLSQHSSDPYTMEDFIVRFNNNVVAGNQYGFASRAMYASSPHPLYFNNVQASGSVADMQTCDGVLEFKNSNFDVSKVTGN